jgi:L-ascorbate metabolism protein UlaG (beta-lactamase superfamily)
MGFEDLLNRRLGLMKDLLTRGPSPLPPGYDPEKLYYRRAAGLDFFIRPEDSNKKVRVEILNDAAHTLPISEATQLARLGHWTQAKDAIKLTPKKLWKWAQLGLVNFSRTKPRTHRIMTQKGTDDDPVKLRAGAWINLALEDLVQIQPVPFMPRRTDLEHAEIVGIRFSLRENGVDVMGLTITGSAKLGQRLQRLVPLLNGEHTLLGLRERLPRPAFSLLEALSEFGFITSPPKASPLSSLLCVCEASQATWLGHASVLYQSAGVNILIDPLFFCGSDPAPPRYHDRPFDPLDLPSIDAVLITHGDNDHFNPNSLAFLDRSTRIVVPRLDEPPAAYHVDIRGVLSRLGFENIIEMSPWSNLSIGSVTVTACPFEGENWGLRLPQLTYLIYSDAFGIYCAADACRMPNVFSKLKEMRPQIDIAFMGVTGCAEPMGVDARYGYGNFYREWIPQIQHREWVQHCMGPEDVCEMVQIFEPRYVFGYAAGGADFIETSYSDVGTHDMMAALLDKDQIKSKSIKLELGLPCLATDLR